jgi:hypothetical protein
MVIMQFYVNPGHIETFTASLAGESGATALTLAKGSDET